MSLATLFEKLQEEIRELCRESVRGNWQRADEELGDCVWVAIMIADHGLMLDLEEAS